MRSSQLGLGMLVLVVACGKGPQKTVSQESASSVPTLNSWDLILNEDDLSAFEARINRDLSTDIDYRSGNSLTMGNTVEAKHRTTTSFHSFLSSLGDITVQLEVFRAPEYAELQMEVRMWSDTHRFDRKEPEGTSLRNYPQAPGDTVEENSFWKRIIPLDEAIGEQTACSQWETFAPEVRFRSGYVVVTVKVGGVGTEHLDDAIAIARMQERKLRKLTGDRDRTE